MKSRVSSTVTKRKPNPRPRKYASASERQAAYRDRAPEVCFRAEPRTVETLDRIADTIDRSRAELLLSMTKFALTNHDWERFGLTHKTLPKYEGNPIMNKSQWAVTLQNTTTKKTKIVTIPGGVQESEARRNAYLKANEGKSYGPWQVKSIDRIDLRKPNPMKTTRAKRTPTPAQLAARERFAEMARAGSFKKAGGRKKNPDGMGSYGPFYGDTDAPMTEAQIERKAESYMDRLDRQLMRNEITQTVYDREVKALDKWAKGQYAKRRKSNPAASGPVKMKIRGSETPDNPEGLIVTEAGALRWAKQNMPKDLKRAGFVPSVVAGARGWSINYGAAVPGHSTYSRNPARKAAGVRRNPASTARFKFVCVAPLEYSGSKYGIDERTPVTLKFAKSEPAASTVYACYQLPAAVVNNEDFQNFAYHNKVLYMSIAQLRTVLKGYAK